MGLVRKHTYKNQQDIDDMKKVKLNIFDAMDTKNPKMPFIQRWKMAKQWVDKDATGTLTMVPCYRVDNDNQIKNLLSKFLADGDEGVIIRNITSPYEQGKRSYNLQKYKKFFDDEYKIVDALEGQGNDIGTVVWICETPKGQTFKCRAFHNFEPTRHRCEIDIYSISVECVALVSMFLHFGIKL